LKVDSVAEVRLPQ